MISVNDAYRILGLSEGAGKDAINNRYDILMRKYRQKTISGAQGGNAANAEDGAAAAEGGAEPSLEDVIKAYNLLMGYGEPEPGEPKKNPVFKLLGLDEKKTKNFLHYYKLHIIAGILILVALVAIVKSFVTRVPVDLNVIVIGNVLLNDQDSVKKNIKSAVPGIKNPGFDTAYLPAAQADNGSSTDNTGSTGNNGNKSAGTSTDTAASGSQDTAAYDNNTVGNTGQDPQMMIAEQQKVFVLLSVADVDVYIMDKDSFLKYAEQGVFRSLDNIAGSMGIDRNKYKDFILAAKEVKDKKKHLYGIDASNSGILKAPALYGNGIVVGIASRVKHLDNAEKFVKVLLKK